MARKPSPKKAKLTPTKPAPTLGGTMVSMGESRRAPVNRTMRQPVGGSKPVVRTTINTGGATGEVNTASNVGIGSQSFKQKTGVNFEFRTIVAGANVTVTQNADTIEISAAPGGSGEVNTGSNVGIGSQVFKQKTGVTLEFRTLVAGANVTITENADTIEIAATPGGGGNTSIMTDNSDGTYTHDDGTGNTTGIDTRAISNPFDNTGTGLVSTNSEDAIKELKALFDGITGVAFAEDRFVAAAAQTTFTLTSTPVGPSSIFVSNGSGQFVKGDASDDYTVAGNDVIFNSGQLAGDVITIKYATATGPLAGNTSIVTDNADGTYTHDDGTGNTEVIDTRAISNPFDPAGSSLTSTNSEDAIKELDADVVNISNSLTDLIATGSFTWAGGTNTFVVVDASVNVDTMINVYPKTAPTGFVTVTAQAGQFTITTTASDEDGTDFNFYYVQL